MCSSPGGLGGWKVVAKRAVFKTLFFCVWVEHQIFFHAMLLCVFCCIFLFGCSYFFVFFVKSFVSSKTSRRRTIFGKCLGQTFAGNKIPDR